MFRPNIFIFMCDQMQKEALQEAVAPNFDKLVHDGTYFDRAYTTNAVCSPARTSLMTGLLPHNHGVLSVTHTVEKDQYRIREQYPHFAMRLQESGYKTGYFGKWHIDQEEQPERFGWEKTSKSIGSLRNEKRRNEVEDEAIEIRKYSGEKGYKQNIFYAVHRTDQYHTDMKDSTKDALTFLDMQKDTGNPWLCFLSFRQPHDPYICTEPYYRLYDDADINVPDHWFDNLEGRPNVYKRAKRVWDEFSMEEKIKAKRCYLASISEVDRYLGTVMDYLKENRLYDDTVIIFTTDHGDHLGSRGLFCKNYCAADQVYNIPMIIKGNGLCKNKISKARVGLHDLCQTILNLGGCESFGIPDSRSFIDVLKDPEKYDETFTCGYAEYFGTRLLLTQRVVYKDQYKFVFNGFDFDELYNLETDPGEMINLAQDPEYSDILKDLYILMWKYVKNTGDRTLENIHYPILRLAEYGPDFSK